MTLKFTDPQIFLERFTGHKVRYNDQIIMIHPCKSNSALLDQWLIGRLSSHIVQMCQHENAVDLCDCAYQCRHNCGWHCKSCNHIQTFHPTVAIIEVGASDPDQQAQADAAQIKRRDTIALQRQEAQAISERIKATTAPEWFNLAARGKRTGKLTPWLRQRAYEIGTKVRDLKPLNSADWAQARQILEQSPVDHRQATDTAIASKQ